MANPRVLTYQPDVSRGSWIRGRLGDWNTIASVVPQDFDAYARIFHPVDGQLLGWHNDVPVTEESRRFRWREIAAKHGTVYHPLMQWDAILAGYETPQRGEPGWQYSGPEQGRLPGEELAAIVRILARHTGTPDACVAALWEGWGWIHGGDAVVTLTSSADYALAPGSNADELADPVLKPTPAGLDFEVRTGPRLQLPGRSYFLFDAELRTFEDPDWAARNGWDPMWPQSPNQLWPEDHAWFLASEIDFDSTVVAGPQKLIDEIVACEELEAMEVPADASLSADADKINR